MAKEEDVNQLIETVDDNGKIVNFELYDVVEFEDKEYALLLPAESDENEDIDEEIVLMRLSKDGEDYLFETIEDDEEFKRVSEYVENLEDEDDDEDEE